MDKRDQVFSFYEIYHFLKEKVNFPIESEKSLHPPSPFLLIDSLFATMLFLKLVYIDDVPSEIVQEFDEPGIEKQHLRFHFKFFIANQVFKNNLHFTDYALSDFYKPNNHKTKLFYSVLMDYYYNMEEFQENFKVLIGERNAIDQDVKALDEETVKINNNLANLLEEKKINAKKAENIRTELEEQKRLNKEIDDALEKQESEMRLINRKNQELTAEQESLENDIERNRKLELYMESQVVNNLNTHIAKYEELTNICEEYTAKINLTTSEINECDAYLKQQKQFKEVIEECENARKEYVDSQLREQESQDMFSEKNKELNKAKNLLREKKKEIQKVNVSEAEEQQRLYALRNEMKQKINIKNDEVEHTLQQNLALKKQMKEIDEDSNQLKKEEEMLSKKNDALKQDHSTIVLDLHQFYAKAETSVKKYNDKINFHLN